jgi:hypothetical protein
VDGEVVDALLGLLLEGLEEDVDVEVLGLALDLLERLVDRDGADRDRAVAQDPLAGRVDVLAGRQVHDRVGAPAGGPLQLLDLGLDRRGHGAVADVGVDLDQEVAADDHRLELRVEDVGRDDRAAAGELAAHELGLDALADGDEPHLLGDLAAAGVVHLAEVAVARAQALVDPRLAAARQARARVVALRAGRVVDDHVRVVAGLADAAERDRERADLDLARAREAVREGRHGAYGGHLGTGEGQVAGIRGWRDRGGHPVARRYGKTPGAAT